ncbi:MAG: bifunctional lysylphosphatidylglycerol flippase/synthetase MprF [Candidatus Saccharimonadales bacterium]
MNRKWFETWTFDNDWRQGVVLRLVVFVVALNGLIVIAGTLLDELVLHHVYRGLRGSLVAIFGTQLVLGLSLLYLSSLLARRKRLAWLVAVMVYGFILGLNSLGLFGFLGNGGFNWGHIIRNIGVPLLVLIVLLLYHGAFSVQSDIQSFRQSLKIIIIVLVVAFLYGVAGFSLMDKHDFHQEISLASAARHTIDQFGLTSSHRLIAYTRRAKLFDTSLSVISLGALAYAALSLFQPIRAKFQDQSSDRQLVGELLKRHKATSDDFFKLWPHDKIYIFNDERSAALAFRVTRGVALTVGDPAGDPKAFGGLIRQFKDTCRLNDWRPAFIHLTGDNQKIYKAAGITLQKIGQEAIVDVDHFTNEVANVRDFRRTHKRFTERGYSVELMKPPHDAALIERLADVSQDWLARPGRAERGLAMGYFSSEYLNQCAVLIARDSAGTIQAFLNQVPAFDRDETHCDMVRHTKNSPSHINDFLLMSFIELARTQGFRRVNLGLCPLAGLDKHDQKATLIDSALRFTYFNGDRFYSFSGLHKFKAKYQPQWCDRYIGYSGGWRGFSRTLKALMRAMKVKAP